MNLQAAIVGLGRIAWKNDFSPSSGESKLTHFSNLRERNAVKRVIGIDNNTEKLSDFEFNTGCESFSEIELVKDQIDFVVICSNTEHHLSNLKEVIEFINPRFLVCEKPLGSSSKETEQIVSLCKERDIKLFIPYFRRFMPAFQEVKEAVNKKIYGEIEEILVLYGQNLRINGCHFVNLADFLVGNLDVNSIEIIEESHSDPSWTMRNENGILLRFISLSTTPRMGEIKIVFQHGVVQISNGGSRIEYGEVDTTSGWLMNSNKSIDTDWKKGMSDFYASVFHVIDTVEMSNDADVQSAITTHQIIDKVLKEEDV